MELIQLLTQNLGVQEQQAKGGAGLLFQLAQQQLSDGDFGKVAQFVPGVGDLIKEAPGAGDEDSGASGIASALGGLAASALGGGNEAPQAGALLGALGGLASGMGGQAGTLGSLLSLAGGFDKLGMDAGMISQFVPVVLSFVQEQGGDEIKEILTNVLK